MKSILYAGAALMIGASIYGFADYSQTKSQGEFKEMYHEQQPSEKNVNEKPEPPSVAEIKFPSKKTKYPKSVTKKDIAKPISPIAEQDRLIPVEIINIDESSVDVKPEKKENISGKKKNRKIDSKIFSRARPRDYDEKETSIILEKKKEN